MKLLANMIGRNENDRFLGDVLAHLLGIADVIVFTDDCSDDETMQVAEAAGAFTYQTPEPLFSTDEGKLRNISWENLERHAEPGDWVLAIDCDEKLYGAYPDISMHRLMSQDRYDVLSITFFHMWSETQFRIDKLWRPHPSSRMFRYFPGGRHLDRKLACGAEPTYVADLIRQGKYMQNTGLVMQHLGYTRDEDKISKHTRYMSIDKGDYHNITHIESIVDENPELYKWEAYPVVVGDLV